MNSDVSSVKYIDVFLVTFTYFKCFVIYVKVNLKLFVSRNKAANSEMVTVKSCLPFLLDLYRSPETVSL